MNAVTTPATYAEATANGWADGRQAFQRGYVSRKSKQMDADVHVSKSGELYVLLPSYTSTRYCIRQYLTAK